MSSFQADDKNMATEIDMYVKKRGGKLEVISFDKILNRIKSVGKEVNIKINYTTLAMKVIDQLYDKIPTTKIDELTAEICVAMSSIHPDYNTLASRIVVSNHHKSTTDKFSVAMKELYNFCDKDGKNSPLVSKELIDIVKANTNTLNNLCDYNRDYLIDYFGFKTLSRAYLMSVNKRIVERPQHMWLRVSIGIHGNDIPRIIETYNYMSQKYFTHATPTLFNSGTPRPQNSSCFLLSMEDDSIDGIYNTLKDCALISKYSGGIGLHIHNVRASGSHIRGTNGSSNGIVPMLRVFNNTAKYVDQCLDPETIIYTKRGAIPIKNIVIGDEVITDDGNFYEIGKVLDNYYTGDVYVLDIEHTIHKLKLTDMHPLWTVRLTETPDNTTEIVSLLDAGLVVPDFIEVKNIEKGDYVGFPIPQYEKDIRQYTEDDCYFYGILIGNGKYTDNISYIDCRTIREHTIQFVETYLEKLNIGVEMNIMGNSTRIMWKRTNMFKFTYEMCVDTKDHKHIMPQMLHLPKPKIKNIIRGIIEVRGNVEDGKIVIDMLSHNVLESMRYMLLRLGILTKGITEKYTKEIEKMRTNIFEIPLTPYTCNIMDKYDAIIKKDEIPEQSQTYFEYNNYIFSVVKDNQLLRDYSGRVIDIEVDNEDHHNFLTHNGLVKNGGGKRNGSFAIYLEPWHADIEMFLQMRKNHGDEELKARDLFYALWIPDLFMQRIKDNGQWTLMCPDECKGLADVHNEEFVELYTKYEKEGKGRRSVSARDLWFKILDAQMETGTPYLLFKDACNRKSNQKNIGTIKSSNLCVAPETKILTNKGHIEIQSVEGQKVNVWNGQEYSEVEVFKTGENQELIEVHTDDGCVLNCTKYHKFFIQKDDGEIEVVEAQNIKMDDKLKMCEFPIIDGKENKLFNFVGGSSYIIHGNCSIKEKMEWFSGVCDSFACIHNDEMAPHLHIDIINHEVVLQTKLLLQTCGINPIVTSVTVENKENKEGEDENREIQLGVLIINTTDLCKLVKLGFQPKKLNTINETLVNQNPNKFVKITKIVDTNRISDTFCFTEPKRNAGIFNGILTSQCTEIIQYSDATESSVCNLSSIALPTFINKEVSPPVFNYEKLHEVTKVITYNLNAVIDRNFYPTEKTRKSNLRHRPMGIGVQGLADVFMELNLSFTCDEARKINKDIFETIYHASLEQSCEMAEKDGSYETFEGSPASQGILQFDMWNVDPTNERYDWTNLKERIKTYGLRNSLLLAPMPTASTSQILGFNECIEPVTSNIYSRKTLAGEFIVINKHLMKDLIILNLWNEKIKNNIIENNGSIQQLEMVPLEIREKYKTVWELPMKSIIDMSADRGAFICQSQSLNLWLEDPNYNNLTSMHFYSWNKGLKTGIYYLRRRAKHQAQQFTIEPEKREQVQEEDEICELCSS